MKRLTVKLEKNVARAIAGGHPWIWRDALERCEARPGEVVDVTDRRGAWLARGIAESGPIAVRVWTVRPGEALDDASIARRLAEAAALRRRVVPPDTNAFRLVHGEGDRMPGVVCDVYAHAAVLKLDGDGAAAWRERFVRALREPLEALGVTALVVRSGRGEEKSAEPGWGELPRELVRVREHGMPLAVDVVHGQKTGSFLDHRESRARIAALAHGARVLNLFGYTGGFSVAAGRGGAARVDTVDLAAPALELADANWRASGLDAARHATHRVDAFTFLERALARGDAWDVVVCDPPSFAPNEAAVPAALASYKKLHAACFAVLAPGGLYLAASCSSHVRRDAFDGTLLTAAERARRPIQLLDAWGAPADHPRLPAFPEGDYLKCTLIAAR